MPQSYECLTIDSNILQFQYINNNIAALYTQDNTALYFDTLTYEIVLHFCFKKLLDTTPNSIIFSNDAKLLAIATENSVLIISVLEKKIIQTLQLKHISSLVFDLDSRYIFIATHEGRVFQYNVKNPLPLSRVCSFISTNRHNTVSALSIYKNILASSNNNGEIITIDFHSLANKQTLRHNKVAIQALCFTDQNKLISGNSDGTLFIDSLFENIYKQISTPFTKIKQILPVNSKYIVFSSESKYISIVDITRNKLVQSKFLSFEDTVKFIDLQNNGELLIVLKNNKIIKNDFANTEKLKSLILHNSLDSAFELVNENPLLQGSLEYRELQTKYTTLYKQAVEALIQDNRALALQLVGMFQNQASKHEEIKLLFHAFDHYERFKTLVEDEKYYIAYPMSEKFPALQYTSEYLQIKEQWKQNFVQAQKYMLQNNVNDAKELLRKFMNITSKKTLIRLLLNNNKEFIDFLQAIDRMQFNKIDLLSRKNKVFLQTPMLKTLEDKVMQIIQYIEAELLQNKVKQATHLLKKLDGSLFFKEKLATLHNNCENSHKLELAYENNDFLRCYELIDTYLYLKTTKLGKLLEKHWSKLISKCEHHALKGDIQGIKTTLGELLTLSTRYAKTGDLLRTAFRSKILQLLKKNKFASSENFIYSYIDIFGYDNEIRDIMKNFETIVNYKLAITHEQHTRIGRDSWIHSAIMH